MQHGCAEARPVNKVDEMPKTEDRCGKQNGEDISVFPIGKSALDKVVQNAAEHQLFRNADKDAEQGKQRNELRPRNLRAPRNQSREREVNDGDEKAGNAP